MADDQPGRGQPLPQRQPTPHAHPQQHRGRGQHGEVEWVAEVRRAPTGRSPARRPRCRARPGSRRACRARRRSRAGTPRRPAPRRARCTSEPPPRDATRKTPEHRHPDQHPAVQVAPERVQRHEPPHRTRRVRVLAPHDRHGHDERQQRQVGQPGDRERRGAPDDDERHDHRRAHVPAAEPAGLGDHDRQRRGDHDEVQRGQPERPRGVDQREQHLGQRDRVVPVGLRRAGERDAVRHGARVADDVTHRDDPHQVGAEDGQAGQERGPQGHGQLREGEATSRRHAFLTVSHRFSQAGSGPREARP